MTLYSKLPGKLVLKLLSAVRRKKRVKIQFIKL